MALTLATVTEFIDAARGLLQDKEVTYRYTDNDILEAMNIGLVSMRRTRPDLFLPTLNTISYYSLNDSTPLGIDVQYQTSLLYFVVGHVQLRDQEDVQDSRSAALITKFVSQLISIGA